MVSCKRKAVARARWLLYALLPWLRLQLPVRGPARSRAAGPHHRDPGAQFQSRVAAIRPQSYPSSAGTRASGRLRGPTCNWALS